MRKRNSETKVCSGQIKALKKALAQLRFAYRLIKSQQMSADYVDTAMAQIAVAHRNLEDHHQYLSKLQILTKASRGSRRRRTSALFTGLLGHRHTGTGSSGQRGDAITVESEVVPMQ